MPRIESHGVRRCRVAGRRAAGAPHLRELRLAHLHLGLHRPRPTRACVRLTARVCARACARVGVSVREHRAHGMCARHARVQLPRPQLTAAHSQPHRDGRARATSMHRPLAALRTAQYRTRPRPLSLTPRMRTLTRSRHAHAQLSSRSESAQTPSRRRARAPRHPAQQPATPRARSGPMPMHCMRQEMCTVRTAEPQLRRRRTAD